MFALALLLVAAVARTLGAADSGYLYGIHWWGHTQGQPVDNNPAIMLDCPTYGGWSLETVLTHSGGHWQAGAFVDLYQNLYTARNVTVITRVDYKWGETVPALGGPDYAIWPGLCVDVVDTLSDYGHIWLIGNEPNVTSEGENWPDNHVTPAGYATIYRNVRNAIHADADLSPAGEHLVLIAAPSPGGAAGVRWMDGNQWLGQVIDNIPNHEIDGVAIHAYGGTVSSFHDSYVSQLNLIDSKGSQNVPVYLTEWNKVSTEAVMAQFVRDAYADLNAWNQTPGNHNVRCLCWFVYDADQQAAGAWNDYAIEYFCTVDPPLGDPNDLYTAFAETVDLRYPSGLIGTRPDGPWITREPAGFTRGIYDDEDLPDDVFTVRNGGLDTLNYSISDNATWLSVSPTTGSSTGEDDPITIHYRIDDLPAGLYPATITVTAAGAGNSPQTVTVSLSITPSPYAPADFNRDFAVDSIDFGHLRDCFTGADAGPPLPGCDDADIDEDEDVDLADFGLLQRCLSEPGASADPDCAD